MTTKTPLSNTPDQQANRSSTTLLWLILIIIVGRGILSALLPVMEFSEARYAEIARQILVTNQWVTLWFNANVPFWGKPPLAFWSIAASYLLLGTSEFSSRLPSLLFSMATGLLIYLWCKKRLSSKTAQLAVMSYATSIIVLQTAGSVITDPLLTLCTTLVMISFWEAVKYRNHAAAYVMWVSLAAGMLTKGLVPIVLCGLACGLWVFVFKYWRDFFTYSHLLTGLILAALITVPWYYPAETNTPGFLQYFFIGEHFERFVQSEWTGDPYGAVKDRPFGTIWLYFLFAALPWSLVVIVGICFSRTRAIWFSSFNENLHLATYLLIWVLTALVFFTPAKNVLVTYVLPSIPAFCILLTLLITRITRTRWQFPLAGASVALFFLGSALLYQIYFDTNRYNQRPIVDKYHELNQEDPGVLIYTGKRRFAPVFYTHGQVLFENTETRHGIPPETFYIAVWDLWLEEQAARLTPRCKTTMHRNEFTLFYCPSN